MSYAVYALYKCEIEAEYGALCTVHVLCQIESILSKCIAICIQIAYGEVCVLEASLMCGHCTVSCTCMLQSNLVKALFTRIRIPL